MIRKTRRFTIPLFALAAAVPAAAAEGPSSFAAIATVMVVITIAAVVIGVIAGMFTSRKTY